MKRNCLIEVLDLPENSTSYYLFDKFYYEFIVNQNVSNETKNIFIEKIKEMNKPNLLDEFENVLNSPVQWYNLDRLAFIVNELDESKNTGNFYYEFKNEDDMNDYLKRNHINIIKYHQLDWV